MLHCCTILVIHASLPCRLVLPRVQVSHIAVAQDVVMACVCRSLTALGLDLFTEAHV